MRRSPPALALTEPMLSKPEISSTLMAHAENLRLASVLRVLARSRDLASEFAAVVGSTPPDAFRPSLSLLQSREKLVHVADQMYLAIVRTALTDGLELTRDYCRRTEQVPILKAQPWFQVFRLLRNALNHNLHFVFGSEDRAVLPVSWRDITISVDLDGKELTQDILDPATAIDWLAELDGFIEKEVR